MTKSRGGSGRGGREVKLWQPQDFKEITALGDGYILQEFAPGAEHDRNVYLNGGVKDVVVVLCKTALKEGITGNALSVIRTEAEDVAQTALGSRPGAGVAWPAGY